MAVPKTIRTGNLGKHALRLVQSGDQIVGMLDRKPCVTGTDAGAVWQSLLDTLGQADPRFVGLAGAREQFLAIWPDGFASDGFDARDRAAVQKAQAILQAEAPLERALTETGLGEGVLKAFLATNLLGPGEKPRLRTLLAGPEADRFVHAAARFGLEGDTAALARVAEVLKPHSCARWTVATYLPFLWAPDRHMYLKPDPAREVAARIGHPFALTYAPLLKFEVYAALLDMTAQLRTELADLEPRDGIDILGFMSALASAPVAAAEAAPDPEPDAEPGSALDAAG